MALRLQSVLVTAHRVTQQLHERVGHGRVVAHRDQDPRVAMTNQLGQPTGAGGDDRQAAVHRVHHRRAEALEARREREDVHPAQQLVHIGAEPREHHPAQVQAGSEPRQRLRQLAVPDDEQPGVWLSRLHQRPRPQEGVVILVIGEVRDDSHDQRAVGQRKLLAHRAGGRRKPAEVDAIGNDRDPVR